MGKEVKSIYPLICVFLRSGGSIGISGSDWRLNGLGIRSGVPPRSSML
jgi:hypothetical protein